MTPDTQEALSTTHARDSFRLRRLASGRWAVWDQTLTLLGITETLDGVVALTEELRTRATADRAQAAASRHYLLQQVAAQKALDDLELELDL